MGGFFLPPSQPDPEDEDPFLFNLGPTEYKPSNTFKIDDVILRECHEFSELPKEWLWIVNNSKNNCYVSHSTKITIRIESDRPMACVHCGYCDANVAVGIKFRK